MQKLHMTRSAASPRRCASAWHDEVSRSHVEVQAGAAAEFVSFTKACPGMRKPATAGNGGVAHGVRPAVPVLRIRMGRTCNLMYCLIGVLLGTLIGVLPGIGPVATIAMLLPITFKTCRRPALIMLAGIYYGAQYGGSTTAILVNLPGESSSVVTLLDGYQMARQGRAGAALAIAAIGSFFAGCVATLLIAMFAPPLAEVALKFGPAEYFSLMVLGLVARWCWPRLGAQGDRDDRARPAARLVGTDVNSGAPRFTFGVPNCPTASSFVAVAMGLFGFAEIIRNLEHGEPRGVHQQGDQPVANAGGLQAPAGRSCAARRWARCSASCPAAARCSPRSPPTRSRRSSRRTRSEFGKGAIEGVAGPEAANNAGAQTSFIPMLTLGIPSNAVMALMVGAMIIQGISPARR
jgi:putative tricarboxylic transport membrane protein